MGLFHRVDRQRGEENNNQTSKFGEGGNMREQGVGEKKITMKQNPEA